MGAGIGAWRAMRGEVVRSEPVMITRFCEFAVDPPPRTLRCE